MQYGDGHIVSLPGISDEQIPPGLKGFRVPHGKRHHIGMISGIGEQAVTELPHIVDT